MSVINDNLDLGMMMSPPPEGKPHLRILDLFAGAGGERRRAQIEARGHSLVTVDFDPRFSCSLTADIGALTAKALPGPFDFVWASPPCETFSVASIGRHWEARDRSPKTDAARNALHLLESTLALIRDLRPSAWLIENPRGMMRTVPAMLKTLPSTVEYRRFTVTYCAYGETRMKPTDLWGHVAGWVPRHPCKSGDPCHEKASRGARTGTQGIKTSAERAVVPWQLWDEILNVLEGKP